MNNAVTDCLDRRLGAIGYAEFLEKRFRVGLHAFFANLELLGDFLVAATFDDQSEHFEFTGRQVLPSDAFTKKGGDVWRHHGPSAMHGFNRSHQFGARKPLPQIAIEVRITREELVIVSYPGPDRSLRLADLQAGRAVARRYRNRRIGEFLKELDLTEGRSTGIPKMLRVLRENGSPAPVFETDDDRSALVLCLPVHPESLAAARPTAAPVTPPVGDHVLRLLKLLQTNDVMGNSEIRAAFVLKDRRRLRETYLAPALRDHLIEYTLPDQPNSRLQKYRLTPQGRALLAKLT